MKPITFKRPLPNARTRPLLPDLPVRAAIVPVPLLQEFLCSSKSDPTYGHLFIDSIEQTHPYAIRNAQATNAPTYSTHVPRFMRQATSAIAPQRSGGVLPNYSAPRHARFVMLQGVFAVRVA